MGIVILVVIVGFLAWAAAAALAGSAPTSSSFTAEKFVDLPARTYPAPKAQVVAAYRRGVERCPGTSVVRELDSELLVDSKPSIRLLGGAFGLVIKFRFDDSSGDTVVWSQSAKKVSWAPATTIELRNASIEIERRIRMAAKQEARLEELR